MHSKWIELAAVLHILQATAWGQPSITSVDSSGTIVWSNCFARLSYDNTNRPIYSVDWALSPTGTWQRAALVTNAYSFTVSEGLRRDQSPLFLRVEWLNATSAPPFGVYEITATNGAGGLELSGRVTLVSENSSGLNGTWELQPPSSTGHTNGLVSGAVFSSFVSFNLSAGAEGPYLLDGRYNGVGFSGRWFRCGVVCSPVGNYTARRICP